MITFPHGSGFDYAPNCCCGGTEVYERLQLVLPQSTQLSRMLDVMRGTHQRKRHLRGTPKAGQYAPERRVAERPCGEAGIDIRTMLGIIMGQADEHALSIQVHRAVEKKALEKDYSAFALSDTRIKEAIELLTADENVNYYILDDTTPTDIMLVSYYPGHDRSPHYAPNLPPYNAEPFKNGPIYPQVNDDDPTLVITTHDCESGDSIKETLRVHHNKITELAEEQNKTNEKMMNELLDFLSENCMTSEALTMHLLGGDIDFLDSVEGLVDNIHSTMRQKYSDVDVPNIGTSIWNTKTDKTYLRTNKSVLTKIQKIGMVLESERTPEFKDAIRQVGNPTYAVSYCCAWNDADYRKRTGKGRLPLRTETRYLCV